MKKMGLRRLTSRAAVAALGVVLLTGCEGAGAESGAAAAALAVHQPASPRPGDWPVVTLYKNPTCHCCAEWAEHLEANGFRVDVRQGANLIQVKAEHGVAASLSSCHTALVGDYVVEGHVPADVIAQLLRERPEIRGLAVPGMPAGVPGMPDPGRNRKPYEIHAIGQDGSTSLYATR